MKKYLFLFALLFLFPHFAAASTCFTIGNPAIASDNRGIGFGSVNTGAAYTYPFTPAGNCTLAANSVAASFRTNNSPTGTVVPVIYTNNAGAPGTVVCTATAFSGITSSYSTVTTGFSSTCNLTGGTQYWMVMTHSGGSPSTSNFYWWGADAGLVLTGAVDTSYVSGTWSSLVNDLPGIFTLTNAAVAATPFDFGKFFGF